MHTVCRSLPYSSHATAREHQRELSNDQQRFAAVACSKYSSIVVSTSTSGPHAVKCVTCTCQSSLSRNVFSRQSVNHVYPKPLDRSFFSSHAHRGKRRYRQHHCLRNTGLKGRGPALQNRRFRRWNTLHDDSDTDRRHYIRDAVIMSYYCRDTAATCRYFDRGWTLP